MSYRNFNVNLRNVPFYDQQDEQMWKDSRVKDINSFMSSGCGVCATAMALANYEGDSSINVDDVISRGYCTAYDPTIKDWSIGFKIVKRDLYGRIAEEVLENKRAVIVYVPKSRNASQHFVTVCGFSGTLPLDPDGYVNYSCATPDMIKIQDPWKGQCSTLKQLEDQRTKATTIRVSFQEETYPFIDSLDRTVEIPKNLNRVAPFGVLGQIIMWPLASDEFVGLSRALTSLETKYIDNKYSSLPDIGQYFGKNNLNVAEIKKLNPQVVIDVGESKKGMAAQLDDIQAQLGIPVIHIEASIDTMPDAYRTLGMIFNKEAKADELATYCEDVLENTNSIIMQAEMFGKKSLVYCMGNEGLNVLAKGTFHTEILDRLCDNLAVVPNPSSKGTGNPIKKTNLEGWNPQVILFGPDSIYSTVGTNTDWQNLQAIQDKTYYEVPNGPYNWLGMPPSVNRYMGMIWLSNLLYPEISSYDMYQETKEYYDLFYNCNLTPAMYSELTQNSL